MSPQGNIWHQLLRPKSQIQTRNTTIKSYYHIFYPSGKNHCAVKCTDKGTKGSMRTSYVSGGEHKMREGRVVHPEGNRGILLTDWRPSKLYRSHSFFIHITTVPSKAPLLCAPLPQPSASPSIVFLPLCLPSAHTDAQFASFSNCP